MERKNVIAAFAKRESGPGWSNQLVWYVWRDEGGRLHLDALQPNEQTRAMRTLFDVSAAVNDSLVFAVNQRVNL